MISCNHSLLFPLYFISVTAYDAAGNAGVATLTVTCVVPPAIRITSFTIASNATAQLSV
jgi:hypothetical protein